MPDPPGHAPSNNNNKFTHEVNVPAVKRVDERCEAAGLGVGEEGADMHQRGGKRGVRDGAAAVGVEAQEQVADPQLARAQDALHLRAEGREQILVRLGLRAVGVFFFLIN